MKISVAMAFSQHTAVDFIKDAVQLVESKGVHGIWVPEHVLFFPIMLRPTRILTMAASRVILKVFSTHLRH